MLENREGGLKKGANWKTVEIGIECLRVRECLSVREGRRRCGGKSKLADG